MSSPPSEAGRHAPAPIVDVMVPEEPPALVCNVIATVVSLILVMLLDFFSSNHPLFLFSALDPAWGLLQDVLPYGPLVNGATQVGSSA